MMLRNKMPKFLATYWAHITGLLVTSVILIGFEGLGLGGILIVLGVNKFGTLPVQLAWLSSLVQATHGIPVTRRVLWAALILFAVTLVKSGISFGQKVIALRLRITISQRIQAKTLADLHRIPLWYLQSERTGNWNTFLIHYSRDVGLLIEAGSLAVASMLTALAYVIFAVLLSWRFTLLAMAPLAGIMMALHPLVRLRLQRANQRMQASLRELGGIGQEHLALTKAVRVFGRQRWSSARFAEAQDVFFTEDFRVGALTALSRPLFEFFSVMAFAVIVLVGVSILSGSDEERLGQIALFLVIAFRLLDPAAQITTFLAQYSRASPIAKAILEFYDDTDRLVLQNGTLPFTGLKSGIKVNNVSFHYAEGNPAALCNLSMSIPKGRTTAVVGASGSGKSSLVNLLMRLYDPTNGAILVDGIDLREIDIDSWRGQVAVVSQEVLIFHASIWENMRFARLNASDEEIVRACKQAQAHDFIMTMPDGYDTILQERGARLSGGQRQRISLARALLSDHELLILDEATSELDQITERAIKSALVRDRQGRTLLAIAHRLTAIAHADHIYVLDAGRVVEEGSHDQLLGLGGYYYRMANAHPMEHDQEDKK